MALANFTLAPVGPPTIVPTTSTPLRVNFDDLLYSPEQQDDTLPGHEPFTQPNTQQKRSKLRKRAGASYLPPPNQYTHYPRHDDVPPNPFAHTQLYDKRTTNVQIENQRLHEIPQLDNTGQYVHDPAGDYDYEQKRINEMARHPPYNPAFDTRYPVPVTPPSPASRGFGYSGQNFNFQFEPASTPSPVRRPPSQPPVDIARPQEKPSVRNPSANSPSVPNINLPAPDRPRGFTKVEQSNSGGKTQIHAILDYDDDYYDGSDVPGGAQPALTPVQGPILLRNGTVPVVPLTSYPTVNNGTFYQIPILWTALSLALGYELQGQIIRGVPCVKKNFQLYCPTAGNNYPIDKIENFIDENKALIKRMYGSFATPGGAGGGGGGGGRKRRAPGVPDLHTGDSYFRHVRQAQNNLPDAQAVNNTGRVDACESKTEIMTPYWALNSARKLRAIVNTMHFEQAIHQEVCSKKSTSRCSNDCGCEQKYKWHRLLAYDPSDDCAGIFMDWFLFPSCCVCRCNP